MIVGKYEHKQFVLRIEQFYTQITIQNITHVDLSQTINFSHTCAG